MCDEVTDSRERRGLTPLVAALTARIAAPARIRASAVSATTSRGPLTRSARTGERSWIATPRSSSRGRSEDLGDYRILGHARRGLDEARLPEPGVDALRLAPLADRAHALRRGLAGGQRALVAEALAQRRQVRPQRLAEAAVAAARPVAADRGLEQHHRSARVGQVPCRPHPGIAAADDHDIGGQLPRGGREPLGAARLA